MEKQLKEHLENLFGPYSDMSTVKELKEELYTDLVEKMNDLISQGISQQIAFEKTINSIGNVSELIDEICDKSRKIQMKVGMDFSMSDLRNSDFSKTTIIEGKFNYSDMRKSNFNDTVLKGSTFKSSDMTDCSFDGADLTDVSFDKSDCRRISFKNVILDNANFNMSDLSGLSFEGLKIVGANFIWTGMKNTSFKDSTLINVTFKSDVKKAIFDGAKMDKITYALLKGYNANLKNAIIIENY